eukprot:TRINITY_DN397_c0_g1_i1.p1 TRINITY_DN397_c0_g1~~TRINITY_DN397_c0_g1_i1.p1  ORF type:complete len:1546 (+),score=521.51 TRINITY_DN397_c0_g1_i1:99-4736(+)
MAPSMLCALLQVAVAATECLTQLRSCAYRVNNGLFENEVALVATSSDPLDGTVVCDLENWAQRERCVYSCPMTFEVSNGVSTVRQCIEVTYFTPLTGKAKMTTDNPLNNKRMTVATLSDSLTDPRGRGCLASDFDSLQDPTNTIVVIFRGGCYFWLKAANAQNAGVPILIIANTQQSAHVEDTLLSMEGYTPLPDTIVYSASNYITNYVFTSRSSNATASLPLSGMVSLDCAAPDLPSSFSVTEYYHMTRGCPVPYLSEKTMCAKQTSAIRRVCADCPMAVANATAGVAFEACAYGNMLLPRKAENNFWSMNELPTTAEVYFLASGGCSAADYPQAVVGKYVALMMVPCEYWQATLAAQEARVAGLFIMQFVSADYMLSSVVAVEGFSSLISITVHTVAYSTPLPAPQNGVGTWMNLSFTAGAIGDVTPEPPAPTTVPAVAKESFALAAENYPWIAVTVLLFGVLVWKLTKSEMLEYREGLPLGTMLSIGSLSTTTLLYALLVTLSLTSGSNSLSTALDYGNTVTNDMHNSATLSLQSLSNQVTDTIITGIQSNLNMSLAEAALLADTINTIYFTMDDTWVSFLDRYDTLVRMCVNTGWRPFVYTVNGFVGSFTALSDDRPDSVRQDGLANITVTNNGTLYGYMWMLYDAVSKVNKFNAIVDKSLWNPRMVLGSEWGDPLAYIESRQDEKRWYVSEKAIPTMHNWDGRTKLRGRIMSLYTPIWNQDSNFLGFIELGRTIEDIFSGVLDSVSTQELRPVIVVFIESGGRKLAMYCSASNAYRPFYTQHSQYGFETAQISLELQDLPNNAISGMKVFLDNEGLPSGTGSLHGSFNLSTSFPQDEGFDRWTTLNITTFGGAVTDMAPVDPRDLTLQNVSIVFDGVLGREAMRFTPASMMIIHRELPTSKAAEVGEVPATLPLDWDPSRSCIASNIGANSRCYLYPSLFQQDYTFSVRVKLQAQGGIIFTDQLDGAANVQLNANGWFQIFTEQYGCEAGPVQGGMPLNSWTLLTVVVVASSGPEFERTCTLYVNGTRDSWGVIASGSFTGVFETGYSYWAGAGMDGWISDMVVYNRSFTAAEVANLHANNDWRRIAGTDEWLLDVRRYTQTHTDYNWWITVLVERSAVFSYADLTQQRTLENLQAHNTNIEQDFKQRYITIVLQTLPILLLSFVAFLFFSERVSRPFTILAGVVQEAAVMRLDSMPVYSSLFKVKEVLVIHTSVAVMLGNLREYKSYLPQSVVQDAMATDDAESSTSVSSRSEHRTVRGDGANSSRVSGSTHTVRKTARDPNMFLLGLSKRTVSYLYVNIVKLHELMRRKYDTLVSDHAEIVTTVTQAIVRGRGIAEVFSGDRFFSTFNAVVPNSGHQLAACTAADEIRKRLGDKDIKISSSCVAGESFVGNMGIDGMKRFSFITPVVTWSHALERFARHVEVSCVIDERVFSAMQGMIQYKIVEFVSFPKLSPRSMMVAELTGIASELKMDEWMYQLEEADKADCFKNWNSYATAIYQGDWRLALKLEEVLPGDLPKLDMLKAARLQERYDPFTIPFH